MCGIGGQFRLDGRAPELSALEAMARALVHRGPDDAGAVILGPCGLVHRRLSILDVSSAGRQPMSDASGRFWVTYNGEIYNYLELRDELKKLGYSFATGTDTEVLLAAFHAWGEDCFPRFNGMWAVAIWDSVERRLILSRDRLGVKPLVLARSGAQVIFASEAKALLAVDPSLASLDLRSVARFLEGRHDVFDGSTFFERIERLPPATVLTLYANGRSRSVKFWRFQPPRRPISVDPVEAVERTRELLADSVRLRFRSDVPVGTCLSGGLDSSSIVSLAVRDLGQRPRAFSVLYKETAFAEASFVDEVERELSIDCARTWPDGGDLQEVLERSTYHQEQPTSAPGLYSQWHVMKLASPSVRVLLDGQGGDELFAGYFGYYLAHTRSLMRQGRLLEVARSRGAMKRLAGFDPALKVLRGAGKVRPAGLAHASVARLVAEEQASWAVPELTGEPLTDALWDHLTRTSIPSLLHFEDRSSMAFSIEARVPFLDYRLVEWAFSLPSSLKIKGARTKVVLRDAMKGILPERVRERQDKKGYPTPFSTWVRSAPWIEPLVLADRGLTDVSRARTLFEEHKSGSADHAFRLFQLATLELFCRQYIDGAVNVPPPPVGAKLGVEVIPS